MVDRLVVLECAPSICDVSHALMRANGSELSLVNVCSTNVLPTCKTCVSSRELAGEDARLGMSEFRASFKGMCEVIGRVHCSTVCQKGFSNAETKLLGMYHADIW